MLTGWRQSVLTVSGATLKLFVERRPVRRSE
jgi:hypothetical protein